MKKLCFLNRYDHYRQTFIAAPTIINPLIVVYLFAMNVWPQDLTFTMIEKIMLFFAFMKLRSNICWPKNKTIATQVPPRPQHPQKFVFHGLITV